MKDSLFTDSGWKPDAGVFSGMFWLVAAFALPLAAWANDIEPGKEFYEAPRQGQSIIVDGYLQDWPNPSVLANPRFAIPKGSGSNGSYVLFESYAGGLWNGTDDHSSSFQIAWDEGAVYVGIVVIDDYHENAAHSAWNGDSVQLMLANSARNSQLALYNYALGGVESSLDQTIVMHEAGPGGTEAVVQRDASRQKTYYEIKLPASSFGFSRFEVGNKFGLGILVNDGDVGPGQQGQKGWSGWGGNSIVFGKTPSQTSEITLVESSVTITSLGTSTSALLGGDLTDPENDGDEDKGASDHSWNWKSIQSSHENGFDGVEFAYNVFDNALGQHNDKWCCNDPTDANPVWITVEFLRPISLTHFTLSSADDAPDRDPRRFQIRGSVDGVAWHPIYTRNNEAESLWTDRLEVLRFDLDLPSVAYNFIQYIAYQTPAALHQLDEIEYFGSYVGDTIYVSGVESGVDFFELRVRDDGNSILDPASIRLKIDGVDVAAGIPTREGSDSIYTITRATPFPSETEHTYEVELADESGWKIKDSGIFITPRYGLLDSAVKVTPDTSKRGFVLSVHQSDRFFVSDNSRAIDQLAGLLGPNFAKTNAQGPAIAPGTPGANDHLAIRFEIETAINMQKQSGNQGFFTPDDSIPGIPSGQQGSIATEILTYVELPAGLHTFVVANSDTFRFTAGNVRDVFQAQAVGEFEGTRSTVATSFTVFVQSAGVYPFRIVWQGGNAGTDIEWYVSTTEGPGPVINALVNDDAHGGFKAYRALASRQSLPTAVTRVSPSPDASRVDPGVTIEAIIEEGITAVERASIKLWLDGEQVVHSTGGSGSIIEIAYKPSIPLQDDMSHTVKLSYTHGGAERTAEWNFHVPKSVLDKVEGRIGFVLGSATTTVNQGGRSGQEGDTAIDFGRGGGMPSVLIPDGTFLNGPVADDNVAMSIWIKHYDIADSVLIWADSPSTFQGQRGFSTHVPWSNNNIYFDTAGCCAINETRINAGIDTLPAYTGEITWWNEWHHFVFQKNGSLKQIWIDGVLFLEGENFTPLPTDFARIWLGAQGNEPDGGIFFNLHGLIDDYVVYANSLAEVQIQRLAIGEAPFNVPGLVAHWDFNAPTLQTIEFAPIENRFLSDGLVTLSATASSGLPVTFRVVSGPAGVVGDVLTPTGRGRVKVRAEQAGNADYRAAFAEQSFEVFDPQPQTVVFAPPAGWFLSSGPVSLQASASSGLPVAFRVVAGPGQVAGNALAFLGSGEVVVRAEQAGDDEWLPAFTERTIRVIDPQAQTIDFAPIADRRFEEGPVTLSATASSGLPVSFRVTAGLARVAGAVLTPMGYGPVTVRAEQPGRPGLWSAYAERTFTILGEDPETLVVEEAAHWPGLEGATMRGVAVAKGHAFLAGYRTGLQIVQLDEANGELNLTHVAGLDTPGLAVAVAVAGDYAYVADWEAGLRVIDIATPSAPRAAGAVVTPAFARGVAVAGNQAYVADWVGGVRVIDISNPASPKAMGHFPTDGWATAVAVVGSRAYVAEGNGGLGILNVSNPAAPSRLGRLATGGWAYGVSVDGTRAALADGPAGLSLIDVQDGEFPRLVGRYNSGDFAHGVVVRAGMAYVLDGKGLKLVEISQPEFPRVLGRSDSEGFAYGLVVEERAEGERIYLAEGAAGLRVLRVQRKFPAAP